MGTNVIEIIDVHVKIIPTEFSLSLIVFLVSLLSINNIVGFTICFVPCLYWLIEHIHFYTKQI